MEKIIIESPKYGTFEVLVDDENFEELNQFKWGVKKDPYNFYAIREIKVNNKRHGISMHRFIMGLKREDTTVVDHKNHNGLDNRKENLRIVTRLENSQNSTSRKNSSSKFLGVGWHKQHNKWQSRIQVNKKNIHLGYYEKEINAAASYNNAAIIHFGEFANLNQIG